MHTTAHGMLDVKIVPLSNAPGAGLTRMSLEKTYHGDLEATAAGEMLSAGDPKLGSAGYVAMESIHGRLGSRSGGFAVQQSGTMDAGGRNLTITVVPGSGTGELHGIAGTMTITIAEGKHSYELDYTLPEAP